MLSQVLFTFDTEKYVTNSGETTEKNEKNGEGGRIATIFGDCPQSIRL